MSKPVTTGQSHALMSIFANSVEWDLLDGDDIQWMIENPRETGRRFREHLKNDYLVPREKRPELKRLSPRDAIPIKTSAFERDSFFREDGPTKLFITEAFRNHILSEVSDSVPGFRYTLAVSQIVERANDQQIRKELGEWGAFSVDEFCALVRHLILEQSNFERRILYSNGKTNIFYIRLTRGALVVATVFWYVGRDGWHLNMLNFMEDSRWVPGCGVISKN
jgi:hypothetical protein